MAANLYTSYKTAQLTGSIAPLTDTIKVMLLTSSYTPNADTNQYYSDISANEVTGTGYTAGGTTLSSKTITQDNTNHKAVFTAANVSWPNATISNIRYAAIYKSTGVAGTSQLIGYIDIGATDSVSNTTFQITWDATGIINAS